MRSAHIVTLLIVRVTVGAISCDRVDPNGRRPAQQVRGAGRGAVMEAVLVRHDVTLRPRRLDWHEHALLNLSHVTHATTLSNAVCRLCGSFARGVSKETAQTQR
jgi:hypothetical protein